MAEQLIDVIGVSKYFGKDRILEDINFSVEKGKTIALVGHNGCGKSTLLRMIALLTTVSGGEIIHHKKWRITYIPERFPKSDFTAREYVVSMGMLEGLSKEEAKERGSDLLKTFFMESMADKPMKYLSKGTLQKTAVIQALLTKADILLMDEPLSG
ncbi:ATP-binding cassette domain-containing protein [Robinsoniella peoriensis]